MVRAEPADHQARVRALRFGAESGSDEQRHPAAPPTGGIEVGPGPVEAFKQHGVDFVVAPNLAELVDRMNALAPEARLDLQKLEEAIAARDREIDNPATSDAQVREIRATRRYLGDRLIRVAKPHRLLDPAAGPLLAAQRLI